MGVDILISSADSLPTLTPWIYQTSAIRWNTETNLAEEGQIQNKKAVGKPESSIPGNYFFQILS